MSLTMSSVRKDSFFVLVVRYGGVPCEIRVLIRFYYYGNIAKATDETLTSENWEYMMDAWEKINESGENG